MAIFKRLENKNINKARNQLSKLVDIISNDISGSVNRQKYQHFVTSSGGATVAVTSSIFQTIYDQNFTYPTANAFMDMSFGLYQSASFVTSSIFGYDAVGKALFPSSTLMMREKVDSYRALASNLLGDPDLQFSSPFESTNSSDKMQSVLALSFRRLFARDKIKKESFATRFLTSLSDVSFFTGSASNLYTVVEPTYVADYSHVFTDNGSSLLQYSSVSGEVGEIVDAADTTRKVGLIFYEKGVAIFDVEKIVTGSQYVTGTIDAVGNATGKIEIGDAANSGGVAQSLSNQKFVPDFLVSGSMDNVLDHFGSVRFHSGSTTCLTFQNITSINSTIINCTLEQDEFNYSSNPTFRDSEDRIVVIDPGQERTQQTFTFFTSVGVYDGSGNLLAIAKTSRPIEKSPEKQINIAIRLQY